jgi:hypothetical protein
MSGKRYRAQCTICDYVSPQNLGPVFAAWHALKHSKNAHPDNNGIVSYVFEVPVQFIVTKEGKNDE